MGKLDKMLGVARVASRSYDWKDFRLQPGCAFGRDKAGALFASFGTWADKFGIPEAKQGHIIVFRCVTEHATERIHNRSTVWGANSKIIGRRPIIAPAGRYSSAWGDVWQYTQVPASSELGREILGKIRAYRRSLR